METEIRVENQRLFSEHPENWPWALVVDKLEEPLRVLAQEARAIKPAAPSQNEPQSLSATRFESQLRLVELFAEGIAEWVGKDLVEACGGHGKEADPDRIDERCGEILTACREIMESEEELVARPVHPSLARSQAQAKGLSLDFIGPLIGMVASLREAIRTGGTPILRVEIGCRRLKSLTLSGRESPPVPSAPMITNANGYTAGPSEIFAVVVFLLIGVGIAIFIGAHLQVMRISAFCFGKLSCV